jgi:uncharacterized Ntn-hydrolase superfamily protein
MTFSIVARCGRTQSFGVAISSSSPAVAARCAHARARAGAAASQNITDPRLGRQALDLMAAGATAESALAEIRARASHIEYRQLALVDPSGRGAFFSGTHTLGRHHAIAGPDAVAAGNLLADVTVPERMLEAFLALKGADLGDRLMAALNAGLAAGGEEGPVHSAGLLIVRDLPFPITDLRIDWDDAAPIAALDKAWTIYKPQREAYITRALDPAASSAFGVPGDPGRN